MCEWEREKENLEQLVISDSKAKVHAFPLRVTRYSVTEKYIAFLPRCKNKKALWDWEANMMAPFNEEAVNHSNHVQRTGSCWLLLTRQSRGFSLFFVQFFWCIIVWFRWNRNRGRPQHLRRREQERGAVGSGHSSCGSSLLRVIRSRFAWWYPTLPPVGH